ncbi:hypothetical protein Tco_0770014 [Tanacetum coccineum]|uniref:Uncharacterized protein n=1 Tax=Tanacetum coccineum TaxID=301880 RepID=A0ABQ4ZEM1_9ASTR
MRKPTRRNTEVTQPSEPEMVTDEDVQIERMTKQSNDPLSGEDILKLNELMSLCTTLQTKGRKIADIDKDADITLVDGAEGRKDDMMFDIDDLFGNEVVVESEAASKDENLNEYEATLAQTLQKLKNTTPKVKGVVIREREQGDTQRPVIPKQKTMDKGKGKMVETEKPVKLSRKEQISFDEKEARRLQALFDEEARIANEEARRIEEANLALIKE